jgi:hypothetical protein
MVLMTLRGQFTLSKYRTEVRYAIEQLHPTVHDLLCVYVVSLDLTRVMYAFVCRDVDTNEVFDVLAKSMGSETTYADMFDIHGQPPPVKGRIFV